MIQSHHFINFNLFSVDKIRPTFPVGTENHWPVSVYEATLSITPENLAYSAMVGTTGATGLPRTPRRSLCPCKRKLPHPEVKTCLPSTAFTNLLLWLHTSSSSGMSNSNFTMLFLNKFKPVYTGHQKTKSSSLPQNLRALHVLPAPLCTNTSICLAQIFHCSVSFNVDEFLGLLL